MGCVGPTCWNPTHESYVLLIVWLPMKHSFFIYPQTFNLRCCPVSYKQASRCTTQDGNIIPWFMYRICMYEICIQRLAAISWIKNGNPICLEVGREYYLQWISFSCLYCPFHGLSYISDVMFTVASSGQDQFPPALLFSRGVQVEVENKNHNLFWPSPTGTDQS